MSENSNPDYNSNVGGTNPDQANISGWCLTSYTQCCCWSYQERLGVKLQLGSVHNVLQSFLPQLPFSIVSRHHKTNAAAFNSVTLQTVLNKQETLTGLMSESHPPELLLVT